MPQFCPGCGRENTDTAWFCADCGDRLSAPGHPVIETPEVLDHRYKIISIIKSGAMGCVYKAIDTRFDQTVAIKKMIHLSGTADERKYAEDRFKEEAQLLFKLHHNGLPKVSDYVCDKDPVTGVPSFYLVMTFIEGSDLESIISEKKPPLPVEEVLGYFTQMLHILDYLHSQSPPVIYRDLNPRNIMITKGKVSLVDFGIARFFTPQQKGTAIGTPGYAPPEQYKGSAEPRSDLYSLAVVMHYLLTGKNPEDSSQQMFHFESVRKLNPHVPEYLHMIVMAAVDIVIDRRPGSAQEIIRMLPSSAAVTEKEQLPSSKKNFDIHSAVRRGDTAAVERFINQGADINAEDSYGGTPLHAAAMAGSQPMTDYLISKGAEVNAEDDYGGTPLHRAARQGHRGVAEFLISKGADIEIKDKSGWTPLRFAAAAGHRDIVELLKHHGAKE
jgi:serine/threonine protein kinase